MNAEKEKRAIQYLKTFEPQSEPYYLCYSGGKDSDCIRILAQLAGVKHDIEHNLTTIDAPETVRYVRSIPGVHINRPELTMWELIVKKRMPPTRLARYCCAELKEKGGDGRVKITGVRWQESLNRRKKAGLVTIIGKPVDTEKKAQELGTDYKKTTKKGLILNMDNDESRRMVESCYRTRSVMVNPIIDWSEEEVWEFLNYYGCQSNPLYQCGASRVGCIGCPMQGPKKMEQELKKYPKYAQAYMRAFEKMIVKRREDGLLTEWKNGKEVMEWWLGKIPGQVTIDDLDLDLDF